MYANPFLLSLKTVLHQHPPPTPPPTPAAGNGLTLAVLMGRPAPSASSSADKPRWSSIVSDDGGCGGHIDGTRSPVAWFTTGVDGRRTLDTAVLSVAALYTCRDFFQFVCFWSKPQRH